MLIANKLSGAFHVLHHGIRPHRLFSSGSVEAGHVYFVATPLGHLQDITIRGMEVLKDVDVVLAEDTRRTIQLLRSLNIPHKEIYSHHDHNWAEQIPKVIDLVKKQGKSIAVVSDAGTPGISDPGEQLARACVEQGVPLHPIPGCNAIAAALSVSGFDCSPFTFFGFLPPKGKARTRGLEHITQTRHTSVLYEAPHRILRTLQDLSDAGQGLRQCMCGREMTKLHEEMLRGTVDGCLASLLNRDWTAPAPPSLSHTANDDADEDDEDDESSDDHDHDEKKVKKKEKVKVKGEFTVVLGPIPSSLSGYAGSGGGEAVGGKEGAHSQLSSVLLQLRLDGVSRSDAVKLTAELTGRKRSDIYRAALAMSDWTHSDTDTDTDTNV